MPASLRSGASSSTMPASRRARTMNIPMMATTVRKSEPRGKARAATTGRRKTRRATPESSDDATDDAWDGETDSDSDDEEGSGSEDEEGSGSEDEEGSGLDEEAPSAPAKEASTPDEEGSEEINEWHIPSDDEKIDENKVLRQNLPRPDIPITIYGLNNEPMRFMPYLGNIGNADIHSHSGCCAHCPHHQWADGSLSEPVEVRCDSDCRASHGAGIPATSLGPPPVPLATAPPSAEPASPTGVPTSALHPFDGDLADLTDDEDVCAPLANAAGACTAALATQRIEGAQGSRTEKADAVAEGDFGMQIDAPRVLDEAAPLKALPASAPAKPEERAAPRINVDDAHATTGEESSQRVLEHAHMALDASQPRPPPSSTLAAAQGPAPAVPQPRGALFDGPGSSLSEPNTQSVQGALEPKFSASSASSAAPASSTAANVPSAQKNGVAGLDKSNAVEPSENGETAERPWKCRAARRRAKIRKEDPIKNNALNNKTQTRRRAKRREKKQQEARKSGAEAGSSAGAHAGPDSDVAMD